MIGQQQPAVAIAATFTAEPVAATLAFWLRRLGWSAALEFAPYNQPLQQLLDSTSLLSRNRAGVNILLVRLEDSLRTVNEQVAAVVVNSPVNQECVARFAHELTRSVKAFAARSVVPCLLVVCPNSPAVEADPAAAVFFRRIEQEFATELAAVSGVHLVTPAESFAAYPVADFYDAAADRQGHIPFTALFFTALGTLLARRIFVLQQPPRKVIVLDCDNTLWRGVVGEDGVNGIRLDAAGRALQEFMFAQRRAGVLLCLCSKNNESDVAEVFEQRADISDLMM